MLRVGFQRWLRPAVSRRGTICPLPTIWHLCIYLTTKRGPESIRKGLGPARLSSGHSVKWKRLPGGSCEFSQFNHNKHAWQSVTMSQNKQRNLTMTARKQPTYNQVSLNLIASQILESFFIFRRIFWWWFLLASSLCARRLQTKLSADSYPISYYTYLLLLVTKTLWQSGLEWANLNCAKYTTIVY